MLAAHALDALDAAEARSLEEHLETCAACRAEFDEWRETAATLAHLAGDIEPSPEVRARLIAAAHAAGTPLRTKIVDDDEARARADEATNVLPFAQPAPSRWSALQKFGAIAAGLIIAALLIALVVSRQRNHALQAELAQLIEHNRQLEAEVARLSSRESELQTEVASLSDHGQQLQTEAGRTAEQARQVERPTTSPIAPTNNNNQPPVVAPPREIPIPTPDDSAFQRAVALSGTSVAPGAHAQLVFNSLTGRTTLTAVGLPPVPSGKTYQLWFIVGKKPISGGIFNADQTGRASLRAQLPIEALKASAFAVTLEASGGVTAPQGKNTCSANSLKVAIERAKRLRAGHH